MRPYFFFFLLLSPLCSRDFGQGGASRCEMSTWIMQLSSEFYNSGGFLDYVLFVYGDLYFLVFFYGRTSFFHGLVVLNRWSCETFQISLVEEAVVGWRQETGLLADAVVDWTSRDQIWWTLVFMFMLCLFLVCNVAQQAFNTIYLHC